MARPVPLFGGLDLKNDPKYVALGRNLTLQNVRFPGVSRAEKRFGQSLLSRFIPATSTLIETGKALGSFGDELLAYDGTALYAYSQASSAWQPRGNLTETTASVSNVTTGINSAVDVVAISNETVEIYAWSDTNGNTYYSARDVVTGTSYQQNKLLQAGGAPQVLIISGFAYIFVLSSIGTITAHKLALANLSLGVVSTQLVTAGAVAGSYFSAVAGSASQVVLAYNTGAGTGVLNTYDPDLLLSTTRVIAVGALHNHIVLGPNLIANGLGTFALYTSFQPGSSATAGLYAAQINNATTTTSSVTIVGDTISRMVPNYYNDRIIVVGSTSGSATAKPFIFSATSDLPSSSFGSAMTMTTNLNVLYGLRLASTVALRAQGVYWLAKSPGTTISGVESQQSTFYLCGITDTAPNPTILNRYLGSSAEIGTLIGPLTNLPSGGLFAGQLYRSELRADAGGTLYTANYITGTTLTFPEDSGLQVVPFNGGALVNCGLTYDYDGTQLVENGFWEFPEGITVATDAAGSAQLYLYFVVYEWTNSKGAVTYSAPSYAASVTSSAVVGGGATHTITLPYTTLTLKPNVKIGLYRTLANTSSPAYKVATIANRVDGPTSTVIVDTVTDATASSGQRLYAPADGSGELENEPAPSFKYMVATKTRVFGIPQDNSYSIWYSKPAAPSRPAEFTLFQSIPIETVGGALTGLSVLDTQAVVFKTQRIYYLPGDGPNAGGQPYNGFPSSLQLIASTTGCTSNQSVLVTAEGLYFQSLTGLTQLSRSLQVNPNFGMPVQPLVQSLTLTGAQAVTAQNQLRWVSDSGTAVIYDYVTQRWSTYTNYAGVGYQPYGASFARLKTNGEVWHEDDSTFLDGDAPVTMTVETSWIKPSELAQGWAAIWYASILGEYLTAHSLTVEVAYDYIASPADTLVFDATVNGNFGFYGSGSPYGSDPYYGTNGSIPYGTAYQPRFAMRRQVCESVKFKIYDTDITGASCALNEIALQLGVIGGLKRVPEGQQV